VNDQLYAPATLAPEKSPGYPLYKRWDGPQNRSGRCGEEKNPQPLAGIELLSIVVQNFFSQPLNMLAISDVR